MGLGTAAVASFEDVVAGSLLVRSVASLASGINAEDENVADTKNDAGGQMYLMVHAAAPAAQGKETTQEITSKRQKTSNRGRHLHLTSKKWRDSQQKTSKRGDRLHLHLHLHLNTGQTRVLGA